MPKQSIVSSQINNNVETDFSQNENDTSSWGATCHHNKSNISENNTKQKDWKSKFPLSLKSPTTDSSSDSHNGFDDKTRNRINKLLNKPPKAKQNKYKKVTTKIKKRKRINNEEQVENNDLSEDSSKNKLNFDEIEIEN